MVSFEQAVCLPKFPGTPTDNPKPPSIWKQMRSAESLVEKEEPEFKVDHRIEGIARDVIPKK